MNNGQHIAMMAYLEGNNLLGLGSVSLPTVKFAEIEIAGPGGTFKVPARRLEAMEGSIKLNVPDVSAVKKLINPAAATRISCRGRFQVYDTVTSSSLGMSDRMDLVVIGSEFSPAERSQGEKAETEFKFHVLSVGYSVDGVEILFADIPNSIYRVDGVDKFAGDRAALGI